MSKLVTEYFGGHLVPRLTIGQVLDTPDGYAFGFQASVGTDGYVIDLAINTVYEMTCQAQAVYYAMLSSDEIRRVKLESPNFEVVPSGDLGVNDDGYFLPLLNATSDVNGHIILANATKIIATTPKCRKLVMKSATSTATVTVAPMGWSGDDPKVK